MSDNKINGFGITNEEFKPWGILYGTMIGIASISIAVILALAPEKESKLEKIAKEEKPKNYSASVIDRTYYHFLEFTDGFYAIEDEAKDTIANIKAKLNEKNDKRIYAGILALYKDKSRKNQIPVKEKDYKAYKLITENILNTYTENEWIKKLNELNKVSKSAKFKNHTSKWTKQDNKKHYLQNQIYNKPKFHIKQPGKRNC